MASLLQAAGSIIPSPTHMAQLATKYRNAHSMMRSFSKCMHAGSAIAEHESQVLAPALSMSTPSAAPLAEGEAFLSPNMQPMARGCFMPSAEQKSDLN